MLSQWFTHFWIQRSYHNIDQLKSIIQPHKNNILVTYKNGEAWTKVWKSRKHEETVNIYLKWAAKILINRIGEKEHKIVKVGWGFEKWIKETLKRPIR